MLLSDAVSLESASPCEQREVDGRRKPPAGSRIKQNCLGSCRRAKEKKGQEFARQCKLADYAVLLIQTKPARNSADMLCRRGGAI